MRVVLLCAAQAIFCAAVQAMSVFSCLNIAVGMPVVFSIPQAMLYFIFSIQDRALQDRFRTSSTHGRNGEHQNIPQLLQEL